MQKSEGWSIAELDREIEGGRSPVAIVEECLRRIEAGNERINALIFVDADAALGEARRAERERRAGRRRGPLHGLPIVVKDMIDVEGWPTTAGSRLFAGHTARADAACVANLRAAGAIILGKANLHELTVGGHANPWYGKVVNPLDASRGTGGTSSGSAAAVAARFCVAAIGTDTGGSNRSPAAATGLVGFKPTYGLIDSSGVRPTAPSLDAVGPLAVTVEDARLLTEALTNGKLAKSDGIRAPGPDLSGVVLALCPGLYDCAIDPSIARGIESWLGRLGSRGARLVELSVDGAEAFIEAGLTILKYEFAREYLSPVGLAPQQVGEAARSFLESSAQIDKAEFDAAQAVRERFRSNFLERMQGVDALLVPTSPGLAPRLSDELTRVADDWVGFGLAGGRLRRWANMLGMPALAVPLDCGEALPASIQIAARPGDDRSLLDLAEALTSEPA